MAVSERDREHIETAEQLLSKLHEHWGDCLWIDAGELIAIERLIELAKEERQ